MIRRNIFLIRTPCLIEDNIHRSEPQTDRSFDEELLGFEMVFTSKMNFNLLFTILLVLILEINAEKYIVSDFVVPKNCSEIQTIRTRKYVPYQEITNLNEKNGGKSKVRTKYKYEHIEMNITIAVCCDGYQNYDEQHCIPVCTKSCGSEGVCSSPENCTCNEGYSMDFLLHECRPKCSSECINGFCMSPDVCSCHEGYSLADDNYTCKPICQNGTDSCSNLEICVEPGICRCTQGYAREILDRQLGSKVFDECKPLCDRECIHGDCVSPNVCQCHKNYTRADEFTCERINIASNFIIQKNCTETKIVKMEEKVPYKERYVIRSADYDYDYEENYNRYREAVYGTRTLYRTEYKRVNQTTSICCDGYQNYDKENCLPVCSKSCGPHGICSKPEVCTCDEGYSMDYLGNCQPVCQFECTNGHCTSPNYCTCNEGYHKISDDYICEPITAENSLIDDSNKNQ